ncbi:Uncharacterised protein [Salmonella enterica subsp. arizonae]|uniref:Uncharacterized protein n=1 Tax=Salmonella enterica subsp. arizonae TaxID=59203 RepID=A0A379TH46_SALER|nr:Uncharacterised protein [Salmonella enterica subsp. arizonae]
MATKDSINIPAVANKNRPDLHWANIFGVVPEEIERVETGYRAAGQW